MAGDKPVVNMAVLGLPQDAFGTLRADLPQPILQSHRLGHGGISPLSLCSTGRDQMRPVQTSVLLPSIVSTTTLSSLRPTPEITVAAAAVQGDRDQKMELKARIRALDNQARAAAAAGEIEQSARAILAALDCERRLAATGPQVLQLIKTRA